MGTKIDELAKRLDESGLLSASDLEKFQQDLSLTQTINNGDELASALVKKNRLTEYQARVLCEGHGPLILGGYVLLDKIGEGGMGMVFRARQRKTKAIVALKLLPPDLIDDESAVKRFRREVSAARRLSHPNIVTTLDSGEDDGQHYLIMEYVQGKNLSARVKEKGPLAILTTVECAIDVAKGLQFAHKKKVIHRDIKPSNLLENEEGRYKILDLGLALFTGSESNDSSVTRSAELTATGAVMGTVDYMAPEQALNSRNADERSDIYSLGCTMFYLLTGKPIYSGETVMEMLVAHREHPIPSLIKTRKHVPQGLDKIFQRMVAKTKEKRYQTTTDVIRDLEECRSEFGYSWMMRRLIDKNRSHSNST
jgi:serine/threonine protein kinase